MSPSEHFSRKITPEIAAKIARRCQCKRVQRVERLLNNTSFLGGSSFLGVPLSWGFLFPGGSSFLGVPLQCVRWNLNNNNNKQLLIVVNIIILGFGGVVVRASAFHLWVRGFDSRYGIRTHVKRVSQRSAESRECPPVSSHKESWQGWVRIKNS